jgi:hypothetical protein
METTASVITLGTRQPEKMEGYVPMVREIFVIPPHTATILKHSS